MEMQSEKIFTGRHKRVLLGKNVLEAARDRMSVIYDLFDHVIIMFSGGKDSLSCLYIARDEAEKRGRLPLTVVFKDMEFIPNSHVEFVEKYRKKDWIDLKWLTMPMGDSIYILGETRDLNAWEEGRKWFRPKPDCAISRKESDPQKWDGEYMDKWQADTLFPDGKVAYVTGIRASESPVRYSSCVAKLNMNYINASGSPRANLCKPIYDWGEKDVFKFLYDNGIPFCDSYHEQNLMKIALRTGSALNPVAAKCFKESRAACPEFHQRLLDHFPEIETQERYYDQMAKNNATHGYDLSWEGIEAYIMERIAEPLRPKAYGKLIQIRGTAVKRPESYPLK